MVTREQLYGLNYYKRNTYMGSYEHINFRLHKKSEEPSDQHDDEKEPQLEAICWRGPFIFDLTPDEEKHYQTFPFSEEGLLGAVDWLNEQHDIL